MWIRGSLQTKVFRGLWEEPTDKEDEGEPSNDSIRNKNFKGGIYGTKR
jgi:hypothetical protein